jgi:predicted transcriptional regulator
VAERGLTTPRFEARKQVAGLQQPADARFERGDTDPRFGTISRICNALDLPVTIGTVAMVA